ncbi:MAG: hypothetical protein M1596_02590 [Firmicutes bacterium]|nr:hypothetical protein [Bacillota bacterium]
MRARENVNSNYLGLRSSMDDIISMTFACGLVASSGVLSIWRLYSWHATTMDMRWYSQALWLIGHGYWKAFDTIVGIWTMPTATFDRHVLSPNDRGHGIPMEGEGVPQESGRLFGIGDPLKRLPRLRGLHR